MSKEIMDFNFEGKLYDVSFVDNYVYIYAVKDLLSGVMVSQLIHSANDFIAVTGFKNFCEKRKSENDFNVYKLIRIGCLNVEKIEFVDTEKVDLFDSRDDLEKFLNEAKEYIISQED